MSAPQPSPTEQARRIGRTLRTPLTLIALLALLFWAGKWSYEQVNSPIPPRPPQPCVDQQIRDEKLQADQVSIRVLNGGDKRGLAEDIGDRLKSAGFRIARVGNTDEKITKTVIVGQSADYPELKLVAAYFPGATVRANPDRSDRLVEVLVGTEMGDFKENAPRSIELKAASICLPALPTSAVG